MLDILFLIIGVAVGLVLAFLFLKGRSESALSAANEKSRMLEQSVNDLKNEVKNTSIEAERRLSDERKKSEELNSSFASAKNENENLSKRLAEQKGELEQLNQKFTKEFENLANRILDEKSQKFTEQNKTNLDIILNPLKDRIKEFEAKVDKTYKDESAERITLKTEIKNLIDCTKRR